MSTPENDIDAMNNAAAADGAAMTADYLTESAAECVNALLKNLPEAQAETMQKRPMLVFGHAILQHLDRRAEETRQYQAKLIKVLCDLRERIDIMISQQGSAK